MKGEHARRRGWGSWLGSDFLAERSEEPHRHLNKINLTCSCNDPARVCGGYAPIGAPQRRPMSQSEFEDELVME